MAQSFHLDRHFAIALPLMFAGAYALATLSWSLLERPFLNLKRFFAMEPGEPSDLREPLATASLLQN
jgi:peptidoglycan/LPS O-acetylase OafA/YrhL